MCFDAVTSAVSRRLCRSAVSCSCTAYSDLAVDELVAPVPAKSFSRLRERGSEFWWLSLNKCLNCQQHWLVAQEERLNDVFVLKRVSNTVASAILREGRWPGFLETYEELLEIGKAHGHAARYEDPLEMLPIAIDLLGQRPDLSAVDFARLGNVDEDSAERVLLLAKAEIAKHGYPYPWRPA